MTDAEAIKIVLDKCHAEGRQAAAEGMSANDSPYKRERYRDGRHAAWINGWKEERQKPTLIGKPHQLEPVPEPVPEPEPEVVPEIAAIAEETEKVAAEVLEPLTSLTPRERVRLGLDNKKTLQMPDERPILEVRFPEGKDPRKKGGN